LQAYWYIKLHGTYWAVQDLQQRHGTVKELKTSANTVRRRHFQFRYTSTVFLMLLYSDPEAVFTVIASL